MGRFSGNTCRLFTMMGMTASYFVVELVVGHIVHSIALVADSFHMLSDLVALIVGVAANMIGKWPQSSKNTFGWQRAEVLGTLVNVVMLVTLCFTILLEAIQRFINTEKIEQPKLMVGVGAGGLFINVIGLLLFGGHAHSHGEIPIEAIQDSHEREALMTHDGEVEEDVVLQIEGSPIVNGGPRPESAEVDGPFNVSIQPETEEVHGHVEGGHSHNRGRQAKMNMRAVFLHVLADALGSVIVIISALLIWLVPGDGTWKLYIDPCMSIILVVIISSTAIPLLRQASLIVMQSVPTKISIKELKRQLEKIEGIVTVHDLHVWQLQPNCIIGTVHIRCKNLPDYVAVSRQVKKSFHDFDIHCTTIQPEFEEHVTNLNLELMELSEGDNQAGCVLDCGPNKTCQPTTCCPVKSLSNPATPKFPRVESQISNPGELKPMGAMSDAKPAQ